MQIEEPTLHFMANTFGKDHEQVKFMVEAFNARSRASTTWRSGSTPAGATRTCSASWRTRATPRPRAVPRALQGRRVDARDEGPRQRDLELFAPLKHDLKKKICIGAVSHRTLQADRPEDVAGEIRKALRFNPARAADRVERLRLRASGLQPRDRVLQGHGDRAGMQPRPPRAGIADDRSAAADPRLQADIVQGIRAGDARPS